MSEGSIPTPPLPRRRTRRRFVVRELGGYSVRSGNTGSQPPGLTVWVADEAYFGVEVRRWKFEEFGRFGPLSRDERAAEMRAQARDLAKELNAAERRR